MPDHIRGRQARRQLGDPRDAVAQRHREWIELV